MSHYKTLGVESNASKADIKKAYKKLANLYHPDKNQNNKQAEERFKKAKEAYEILSNDKKRKQYDLGGHSGEGFFNGANKGNGFGGFGGFSGFGGGFGKESKTYGRNSFEDIMRDLHKREDPNFKKEKNDNITKQEKIILTIGIDIAYSGGEETIVKNNTNIKIKIPAKTKNGTKLRLKGKGDWGKDIIVEIKHGNSNTAFIEDNQIILIQYVDVFTMFTGGDAVVNFFEKRIKLTINPNMQNCTRLAMPNPNFENYKCLLEIRGLFPNNKKDLTEHMEKALHTLK